MSSPRKESVIVRVVSYLKGRRVVKVHVLRFPKTYPIGRVFYTVHSELDPVTFNKRKDAEAFKKLLALSSHGYKADIIRREVTEEGYEPTYGDERK